MYITVLKPALKPNGPIWIQSITLFLKPEFWYSDFLGASKCFRDWPSKCGRPNSIRKPSKCRLRSMKFWAVTLDLSYCILQSSSSKRAKNLAFRICRDFFHRNEGRTVICAKICAEQRKALSLNKRRTHVWFHLSNSLQLWHSSKTLKRNLCTW